VRVLHGRSLAFIKYKYRVSAEFAKEAMADQALIKNEVISIISLKIVINFYVFF
jgi:hypothetical protein